MLFVSLSLLLLFVLCCVSFFWFFFFKQKTAYEMRISDWSSDVCSSDLAHQPSARLPDLRPGRRVRPAGPGHGLRLRPQPLRREQARGHREVHGADRKSVV